VAIEIAQVLNEAGFAVIGSARAVAPALSLLDEIRCDAAVLDINLGAEASEPVAYRLLSKGTPFVTLSGYSRT
jgi:DNA-binding response OmpR family regulator